MSSTITMARAVPTTMTKKEEVDVHFGDLDFDDEQDVDVDEDMVLPPITHLGRRIDTSAFSFITPTLFYRRVHC